MIWLYRLQQRLAITRREGLALITLAVLFVTGLTVRSIQKQRVPPLSTDSLATTVSTQGASTVAPAPTASSEPSPDSPLPLNNASATELEALPGIGPALAERIIDYRTTQRPFQRPQELKRVRGIGPATLSDLRPLVTIAPPADTSR